MGQTPRRDALKNHRPRYRVGALFGSRWARISASRTEVYAPRYGGYDPSGVARGVARPGNPLLWKVAGERLYLFYDAQAQAEFAADQDAIIAGADEHWPEVERTLAR